VGFQLRFLQVRHIGAFEQGVCVFFLVISLEVRNVTVGLTASLISWMLFFFFAVVDSHLGLAFLSYFAPVDDIYYLK